ncbi:hypothetical protein ACFY5D_18085 [Paeniglutamicibacter sp. NPDC012692]|uniref:hypothetical protein n=1 Tax=Paeniglutamicibacter sp. NPDC012692 TaxID=3364388 RepID=UPI0036A780F1
MNDNEDPTQALFELEKPEERASSIEKSVYASIEAIRATAGIPASKEFLAQTAMELARSIYKGNLKGRAVAQESAQLVATLELLEPVDDAADDTNSLPDDVRKLFDAFAASPALPGPSAPAPSHAA